MYNTYQKLLQILTLEERKQTFKLIGLMLGLGLLEMIGVASIVPLITVLSNPDLIETNEHLKGIYEYFAFTSIQNFLIFLTSGFFLIIVLRIVYIAWTNYVLLNYAEMRCQSLSLRLLSSYLQRPYTFFLDRHSADLGKTLLAEVQQVINGSLMPFLNLLSQIIISVFLISAVVAIEPKIAVISMLVLAGSYTLVYLMLRGYLLRKGRERLGYNRRRFKVAQEVLAGVKEVKVAGLENEYLHRYNEVSTNFHKLKVHLSLVKQIPQHFLQVIAFGGVLTVILVLLVRAEGNLENVLPTIALYVFAGMRIIPVVQAFFKNISSIRVNKAVLDELNDDLVGSQHAVDLEYAQCKHRLGKSLALKNVTFSYPASERVAIKGVSLVIPANSCVGFVGTTGAGKSTMVDLITGLLEPQLGAIEIDGVAISRENVRGWQRSIGYVPQQIFIADETIAENIALGIPFQEIDIAAVERAAKMAGLHDFIVGELPEGYGTEVGDRGIRLSGGQRQRLGLARAVYEPPEVLILDEATSALDSLTERAVMQAVRRLDHDMTVIIVAHRLGTVKKCDNIFLLEKGKLLDSGSFSELMKNNDRFHAMTAVQ